MSVFPVYNNLFKIQTTPAIIDPATPAVMSTIADMETFSVSIDNGIEEWNPMESEGWTKRLLTSKSMTIGLNGKRNRGDTGNDYVAGLALLAGASVESVFEWTFPTGTKVTFPCIVNVSTLGGDSTAVDALEFEILTNGKPTVS